MRPLWIIKPVYAMNWLASASVVIGLIGLAFETMPWGLLILAGLIWFGTIDMRAPGKNPGKN